MITVTHNTTTEDERVFDLVDTSEQAIGNKVQAYMDALLSSYDRQAKAIIVRDVSLTEIETKLGERE